MSVGNKPTIPVTVADTDVGRDVTVIAVDFKMYH